jgi:hypothetical protein
MVEEFIGMKAIILAAGRDRRMPRVQIIAKIANAESN